MNEMTAPSDGERFLVPKHDELPRRLPNIVTTPITEYSKVEWDGYNTSGEQPTGDAVLVMPDQPLERSSGGIYHTDEFIERAAMAAESGVIVAIGDGAWFWNQDRTRRYEGMRYKVGDRCCFTRYAGQVKHGIDGMIYRLVSDKEIGSRSIPLPDTHEYYLLERTGYDAAGNPFAMKPLLRVRMKQATVDGLAAPAEQKAIEHRDMTHG